MQSEDRHASDSAIFIFLTSNILFIGQKMAEKKFRTLYFMSRKTAKNPTLSDLAAGVLFSCTYTETEHEALLTQRKEMTYGGSESFDRTQ